MLPRRRLYRLLVLLGLTGYVMGMALFGQVFALTFTNGTPPPGTTGVITGLSSGSGSGGAGDVSSVETVSVDGQIVLASGTTGKTIKLGTTTGILKGATGVVSAATAGTDYVLPGVDINSSHQVTATHLASPLPVAQGGTGLASGTSGGIPAYTASGTIASSAALTANNPVIGGGSGAAPSTGTRSGNTTEFGTTTGAKTTGQQLAFDASGNIIASTSATGFTIQNEGTPVTKRDVLNFTGATVDCVDNPGSTRTDCTIGVTALRHDAYNDPASPFAIDAATHDTVSISELTHSLQLDPPTGTPTAGQILTIAIKSTVARTLTFSTASNGFAAGPGQPLPTSTIAGLWRVLTVRWNSISSKWDLMLDNVEEYFVAGQTDTASPTAIDANVTHLASWASLSQDTTIANPTGTMRDGQRLNIRIVASAVRALTWGSEFAATDIPLPTSTIIGTNLFGFIRNAATSKWEMAATNQSSTSARRRTCMIVIGSDNGSILSDADLGPQLHLCDIPTAATVEEIAVRADGGTPSVIVHRRTGSTNTALVSSALATAASGAVACSRPTAVAGFAGATCAATLQNTTITGGDFTIGLTSGTAGGTAKRMSITVYYLLNS